MGKTKQLFIANLPKDAKEDDLMAYFKSRHPEKYGTIESIKLIKVKNEDGSLTDKNKGFGFIFVSSEDMADKMAIQHGNFTFGGRKIELKKSVRTVEPGAGRGRGRGGRGGDKGMRGGREGGQFQGYGGYDGGYGGQWQADPYGYGGYGGGFGGGYGGGYGDGYGYGAGGPQAAGGRGRGRGRGGAAQGNRFQPY